MSLPRKYNHAVIGHPKIWVNYNDHTTTGIMVSRGNHPQMALFQVSEILQFTQENIFENIRIGHQEWLAGWRFEILW